MKLYIFRRINRDFERIPIEVEYIRERSVIVRHKNQLITLEWDSEYTFEQLKVDDIFNVYILGEDYTKGYVLPILRDLGIKDLDVATVMASQLDRIKERGEKEKAQNLQMLLGIINFYTGRRSEDLDFLKEIITVTGASEDKKIDTIKNFLEQKRKQSKIER